MTTTSSAASARQAELARDELPGVTAYGYEPGIGLPLFLEPEPGRFADLDATLSWFGRWRPVIDRLTTEVGAVVLRGFPIHDSADFSALVGDYPSPEFGYAAGATPRRKIEGRAFEATRAPAQHVLHLHQEMAYLPTYPARIAFFCKVAAETGGETLIGDMRRFDASVDPGFRARLKDKGVLYTRNFRAPDWTSGDAALDTYHRPWTEAFDTTDPRVAEDLCAQMGLGCEWVDGSLSVIYRAPGFVAHPETGADIWFNQVPTQTLSVHNIGQDRVDLYTERYGDRPRPYDTRYGDGAEIRSEDVDALYPLLDDVTVGFPWQHGDVMFVDNFNTAHGRNSYAGSRDVQVALLG